MTIFTKEQMTRWLLFAARAVNIKSVVRLAPISRYLRPSPVLTNAGYLPTFRSTIHVGSQTAAMVTKLTATFGCHHKVATDYTRQSLKHSAGTDAENSQIVLYAQRWILDVLHSGRDR